MPRAKKTMPRGEELTIQELIARLKKVQKVYPDLSTAVEQVILGLETMQHRVERPPGQVPPPPLDQKCELDILIPPKGGSCFAPHSRRGSTPRPTTRAKHPVKRPTR
jgi:hypothetical protein